MKILLQFITIITLLTLQTFANGVAANKGQSGTYLLLQKSNISVSVDNQIAVTTTQQTFYNSSEDSVQIKYAFPMPENASAIELKYFVNGLWYNTKIKGQPQDSTVAGGGETDYTLKAYLGNTPLYFDIDQKIAKDSILIVELKYVELLTYNSGEVFYTYPNDYSAIQTKALSEQSFNFVLESERTIEDVELTSHIAYSQSNTGNYAELSYGAVNTNASDKYSVTYTLNLDELGLYGFSIFQPDSLIPDGLGNGYFTFIAEPDPKDTAKVINKTFSLVIDRSGSMGGTKIEQAKSAAEYIIQNLNTDDYFNIIDFTSTAASFRSQHVKFNQSSMNDALDYINAISAGGGTSLASALSLAIPQYASAPENNANVIVFLTDGQGLMSTEQLLAHVNSLTSQNNVEVSIFTFGIGSGANRQLLTQLASENNGTAFNLEDTQLEEALTQFYTEIKNPVLLNTEIVFSSNDIVEILPGQLPNLYQGQQMIVSGRYSNPGDITITLNGEAFGEPVQYQYSLILSGSAQDKYHFIPKVWAKRKIEDLLIKYYSLDSGLEEAQNIKAQIIEFSMAYGIITEFTSYTGDDATGVEEESIDEDKPLKNDFELIGNYPNPFNPSTKIRFYVGKNFNGPVTIRIYDALGQLVNTLTVQVNGTGYYEAVWHGDIFGGKKASSGMYIYVVDFGKTMLSSKMLLLK